MMEKLERILHLTVVIADRRIRLAAIFTVGCSVVYDDTAESCCADSVPWGPPQYFDSLDVEEVRAATPC